MNKKDLPKDSLLSDKKNRRGFLKDLSLASAGTLFALSQTDKVFARWLNKKTGDHVNEFLEIAKSAELSEASIAGLASTALNVIDVINHDEAAKSAFERLYTAFVDNHGIEVPSGQPQTELELPLKISDTVTAAFLYVLKQLGNGLPSKRQIKEKLADPESLLGMLEPEFIKNLADNISENWRTDSELSLFLNTATARFQTAASSIYEEAVLTNPPTNDCGCWAGGPNGEGCLSTVQCIVIVVIIVAIIIVGLFK